jgi:hypothetical protein
MVHTREITVFHKQPAGGHAPVQAHIGNGDCQKARIFFQIMYNAFEDLFDLQRYVQQALEGKTSKAQDTECKAQDNEFKAQDNEFKAQDYEFKIHDYKFKRQEELA